MKTERTRRQKAIIRRRIFLSVCCLILALIILLITLIIKSVATLDENTKEGSDAPTSSSELEENTEPYLVSTATVLSTGDIMVHSPQLTGAYNSQTGDYDFSAFFKYASEYYKKADAAIANLEVTFGGTQSGAYSGYPAFNTPDNLADVIKQAGITTLLTTNNHSYDTGLFGMKRTLEVLKERNIPYVGTRASSDEDMYLVSKVNGINIGMTAFTYENANPDPSRKSLNGNIIALEANDLINSFNYDNLDSFYQTAEQYIKGMEEKGAEFIVFYMHWGEEYQLSANTWQKTIAQKLCNMGVDMIIGGHPHVIQPMDLLYSEDSENTCVCIYSLGNAVSNQRQELMVPECTTGHTEDGVMFYYTLEKYSDSTVALTDVNIIPTWVDKYSGGNGYLYTIYPLESENAGAETYGLWGTAQTKASASYRRTMEQLSEGLSEVKSYLSGNTASE